MSSWADLEWWWRTAPTLRWTRARTYEQTAPHWYCVKGKTPGLSDTDFERAVLVTRAYGLPGKFYRMTNVYLPTPDYRLKFWTQGAPLAETIILNLARADEVYGEQTNFDHARLDELRQTD